MTSNEHQNLVDALVKAFIGEGYTIESADSGSYPRPPAIGRHEPDIIAKTSNGLIIIGEAKTREYLNGEISKEQFIDFSDRIMASGLLKGQAVSFHVVVKKDAAEDLRLVLHSLGLGNKIGNIITIWTL